MRTKKITKFLKQDPFEPINDPIYLKFRSTVEKEFQYKSNISSSHIIELLKGMIPSYRWDVFCWLIQKYPFNSKEICSLFKFSWLFSTPDVRAVELLQYYIDNRQLMTLLEQDILKKLPEEITIYKAVLDIDMIEEEDEEWDPGFDWKWSMDLKKTAYISHCLGTEYVVISTKVKRTEVRVWFQNIDFSYELIAEGNRKEREEYELVICNPSEYLQSNPYHHLPITKTGIYKNCGF